MKVSSSVWIMQRGFEFEAFRDVKMATDLCANGRSSALLTLYPMDVSVYDWAVSHGFFRPKRDLHRNSAFITSFSSAHLPHIHVEKGVIVSGMEFIAESTTVNNTQIDDVGLEIYLVVNNKTLSAVFSTQENLEQWLQKIEIKLSFSKLIIK